MKKTILVVAVLAGIFVLSYLAYHEVVSGSIQSWEEGRKKPCNELPSSEEVMKILEEHDAAYRQIEQILERKGWIDIDYQRCPGKAEMDIVYPTINEREKIKSLIGDTFFGVPYRLNNI